MRKGKGKGITGRRVWGKEKIRRKGEKEREMETIKTKYENVKEKVEKCEAEIVGETERRRDRQTKRIYNRCQLFPLFTSRCHLK